MDEKNMIELLGYCGSAIITLSFMMKDILMLRWFNFTGSVIFIIYGLVIEAYPVVGMNMLLVCIHVYHLMNIYRQKVRLSSSA